MVTYDICTNLYNLVLKEKLQQVLNYFRKGRSPRPGGWTVESFIDFFNLFGEDLLRVVEDVQILGKVPHSMNLTFITLIYKVDHPSSFDGFRPMSL